MSLSVSGLSPFSPFRYPGFKLLWFVWLAAHLTMWMNDVAAAWLMTMISGDPLMIALVQCASTLPVFLLVVPCGALADIVNRRRFLLFAQIWVALVAVLLSIASAMGKLSPMLLLTLTFANGVGLALRWPTFAAVIAEVVPRTQLPIATALSGMALNSSRILGPLIAGALIAAGGAKFVYMLNAVLAVCAATTLCYWRYDAKKETLPSERLFEAIWVGAQHVSKSPRMRAVLGRTAVFTFTSVGLIALLPVVVTRHLNGGAQSYTVLMSGMGAGAIGIATLLPRIRQRLDRESFVTVGTGLLTASCVGAALAPSTILALPAMVVAGAGWLMSANALNVSAHFSLPDWARARGIAFYQMMMMGGNAVGAACWGQLASVFQIRTVLIVIAVTTVAGWLMTRKLRLSGESTEAPEAPAASHAGVEGPPIDFEEGPVQVTVEYNIEPDRAEEFIAVMRDSQRAWLQSGVRSWALFRDAIDPARYFEQFEDKSWAAYLRRRSRVSSVHIELKQKKSTFQKDDAAPQVTRRVAVRV